MKRGILTSVCVLVMTGAVGAEEVCMDGVAPGVNWCAYGDGNLQEEIHWATVDLTVPEVYLRVTRETEGPVTTSQEAINKASSVTINGDWNDDNYEGPHGLSVGNAWQFPGSQDWDGDNPAGDWSFLACTADKLCRMNPVNLLEQWTWNEINVIGGNGQRLVVDGVLQTPDYDTCTRPRSGVCLDITGEIMTLFVAEGDSVCGSDTGWTPTDFAQFVYDHGCYNGLMLDGGGSSDLVINQVRVTDRPPDEPDERVSHNHLSIIHHPSEPDTQCTALMNGRRCDGDTLVTCQGGYADAGDCAFFGATCEEGMSTAYCFHASTCPNGANADVCQDDSVMTRCSLGQPTEFDCSSIFGASCEDTTGGARCIHVGCVNGGDTAWCDGDMLKTCTPDMLDDLNISTYSELDCAASGQSCQNAACVAIDDDDDDGSPNADDCAPDDPTIYPGADELCNELDDDCDGETDENPIDANLYYLDIDGDGYGNPLEKAQQACEPPPAYVDNKLDCNDTDYETNPGKDETCNLSDDDCDGDIDEDATNTQTLYLDIDGDGYGNPNESKEACFPEEAWVADNTDCNDADYETHPGHAETCNLSDDDCDGDIDEDATNTQTLYLDSDGDGYGDPDTPKEACFPDASWVIDDTDCDDDDDQTYPGAEDIPGDGADQDCDGSDATAPTEPDATTDNDAATDSDATTDNDAGPEPDSETGTDADAAPSTDTAGPTQPDVPDNTSDGTGTDPAETTTGADTQGGDSASNAGNGDDTSLATGGTIPGAPSEQSSSSSSGGCQTGGTSHTPAVTLLILLTLIGLLRRRDTPSA